MSEHKISALSLLQSLPDALREDPGCLNLATPTAAALMQRWEEVQTLAIYTRIDELDEALLDILAKDFKVDWWDVNATVDQKRKLLKNSWHVHRILGTKAAVETVLKASYSELKVLEWFEYGGEPMHFRLQTDSFEILQKDISALVAVVDKIKRLSCHLEAVQVMHNTGMNIVVGVVDHLAMTITYGSSEKDELFGVLVDEKEFRLLDELGHQLFDY